jgi:carbonic anhydrase/acetyltransferase-like protein (isoleucine patch superfamily)
MQSEKEFLKELFYSEISSERVAVMELSQQEYALDLRSPALILKANLDGLRWHFDNLLNFDPSTTAKFRERLLRTNGHHSFYCKDAKLAFDCTVGSNTIVLDNCTIGESASLHSSIVYTNVELGENSAVDSSVVGHRAKIGAKSHVTDSVIGSDCVLAENCRVVSSIMHEGTALAAGEKLEHCILMADGQRLPYMCKSTTNKAILEDNFELDYANDEEQQESEVGRGSVKQTSTQKSRNWSSTQLTRTIQPTRSSASLHLSNSP